MHACLQDKLKLEKARAREAAAVRAAAEAHQQQAAAALAGKKPTIQRNKYVLHTYCHVLTWLCCSCTHSDSSRVAVLLSANSRHYDDRA